MACGNRLIFFRIHNNSLLAVSLLATIIMFFVVSNNVIAMVLYRRVMNDASGYFCKFVYSVEYVYFDPLFLS